MTQEQNTQNNQSNYGKLNSGITTTRQQQMTQEQNTQNKDQTSNYGKLNSGITSTREKATGFLKDHLMIIVLLINIITQIVNELWKTSFEENPFTAAYFLDLIVSIVTSMFCYMCFIPLGANEEKELLDGYHNNITLWGKMSDIIRKGNNEIFRKFCIAQIEQERSDKRRQIVCDNTLIGYDEYMQQYFNLTKEQVKELVEQGKITKKEAKYINIANGHRRKRATKVKPINPVIVLAGVEKGVINDAGRSSGNYIVQKAVARPFLMIIVSMAFTLLTHATNTYMGFNPYVIAMDVLKLILASFLGYTAGVNSIKKDNDKTLQRIFFLNTFGEKCNVDMKVMITKEN